MSNAVSALQGASSSGFAEVQEVGLVGMVTLKADLSDASVQTALSRVMGLSMPDQRRVVGARDAKAVAWMAPDELLLVCPHAEADAVVAALTRDLGDVQHLAVNVSDARAVFSITARDVRDVLGKLTPADLGSLEVNEMRRSRLAQVSAAFWMSGHGAATVICFRSVAQYTFDLLHTAVHPGGEVGYY